MPGLRRRRGEEPPPGRAAEVPWALRALLADGPAPLEHRVAARDGRLDVALVLAPGDGAPADAGLPAELLAALPEEGASVRVLADEDAGEAAAADVVVAAGWAAAPRVLTLAGARARAVLATGAEPPLAELGWAVGVTVLGPAWLGGTLPPAADAAYAPMPVHRREDLVLVHGEDVLGLLAAAELLERRDDLTIAVSGARADLELPFPFLGVGAGAEALAHAFASATVALAPPVRGWRPAAVAMLACGQPVVASGPPAAQAALGGAVAFAVTPADAASAAERVMDDLELRGERVRAGFDLVRGGWAHVAEQLVAQLHGLA